VFVIGGGKEKATRVGVRLHIFVFALLESVVWRRFGRNGGDALGGVVGEVRIWRPLNQIGRQRKTKLRGPKTVSRFKRFKQTAHQFRIKN